MIEEKKVRLHKKDGAEFIGSPKECAEVLVRDALRNYFYSGRNSVGPVWETQEFCENFGLSARSIAKEMYPAMLETANPFNS